MSASQLRTDSFVCLTCLLRVDGNEELNALVLPAGSDLSLDWADLARCAVASWRSPLHPEGHEVSVQDRMAVMLAELGWSADTTPQLGAPFTVVRSRGLFRAVEVTDGDVRLVLVLSPGSGQPLATYELQHQSAEEVLGSHGWSCRPLPGWAAGTLQVEAVDWTSILEDATAARRTAQQHATQVDQAWRALVREAVLDGAGVATVGGITGLTRQRVYQIRDRRR